VIKPYLGLLGQGEPSFDRSGGRLGGVRRTALLRAQTYSSYPWSSARDKEEVERAASQGGCRLNVVMEVDCVENIKALVAAGMDYTLLSSRVARHGPNATQLGDAVRLAIPPPNGRPFWPVARSSKAPLSAAASSISESLSLCSFAGTGQKRRILRTSHLPLLESKLWRPRMEKRTAYEKRSVRSQTANYDA
jgi:hypothetical protein